MTRPLAPPFRVQAALDGAFEVLSAAGKVAAVCATLERAERVCAALNASQPRGRLRQVARLGLWR